MWSFENWLRQSPQGKMNRNDCLCIRAVSDCCEPQKHWLPVLKIEGRSNFCDGRAWIFHWALQREILGQREARVQNYTKVAVPTWIFLDVISDDLDLGLDCPSHIILPIWVSLSARTVNTHRSLWASPATVCVFILAPSQTSGQKIQIVLTHPHLNGTC